RAFWARPTPSPPPPSSERECVISADHRQQPAPAQLQRPSPQLPRGSSAAERKEDDLSPADEVLERHVAHIRKAAVLGIFPVVAHHEEMASRNRVDAG